MTKTNFGSRTLSKRLTAIIMAIIVVLSIIAPVPASRASEAMPLDDAQASLASVTDEDFVIDDTGTIISYIGVDTEVTIPETVDGIQVTKIGSNAFNANVTWVVITSITFPTGLVEIGDNAFQSNSLGSVTIPGSVTTIGKYAFEGAGVASIELPSGLTFLGEFAFAVNGISGDMTFPVGLTNIPVFHVLKDNSRIHINYQYYRLICNNNERMKMLWNLYMLHITNATIALI